MENSSTQALALNLATEIAGAVLIFFVVNRIFALDEREDMEELKLLRKDIQSHFSPYTVASDVNSSANFIRSNLGNASQIDIVAISKVIFLRQHHNLLVEVARKGIHIRMIIVDHYGKAGEVLQANAEIPDGLLNDYRLSLGYINDIQKAIEIDPSIHGSLDVRLTRWIPGNSMTLIHSKEVHLCKARISLYSVSFRRSDKRRRLLLLDGKRHIEDIQYFKEQFQKLWDIDSKPMTSEQIK